MGESVYQFRTALSGFHKGDVTAYIEKTASEHRSALLEQERIITELQKENRSLQQQLNLLMMATPVATPAPVAPPAPEPVPVPEPAPAPVSAPVQEADMTSLELQAYRRAEAVEHAANLRAQQLYQQLNGLCGDAMNEFRVTDAAVKKTLADMMQQASDLEQAYEALTAALAASREKLETMSVLFTTEE